MAVLANINGHIHSQLTRSLERILEEANQSGELKLSNRKLKEFPKAAGAKYNLSDTVIADLSKNRFSELPEEVADFIFLERLQCYHNAIRYIPDSISGLQCLNFLDLSRNQLTTLPREICQLPIQILLVSNNRLTCLPDELCRMSQLTELDASCNQLTHLPPRMGELRSLQSLVLRNNLLLCVPVEVTYLSLTRLDLRANRIGTLPVEMRNMTSLITLMVEDNPLTSPPASLCRRGQVHIFKYLEIEAIKLDRKMGITSSGTLGRKSRRGAGVTSSPGPPCHLTERLKHKRHNVDSGYSTSDDKRWSQEGDPEKHWVSTPVTTRTAECNGANSAISTPSTISPIPDAALEEDLSKGAEIDRTDFRTINNSVRLSPNNESTTTNTINGNGSDEKPRPLHQIQTYREYKEALKQQRAQDVPSIYRTKDPDDHSYKTEPNTPTHYSTPTLQSTISTSKSDPTPLNSAFSSPRHIFDDTKPPQKHFLNGNSTETTNGCSTSPKYVKPRSPVKGCGGILSHDNVPGVVVTTTNGKGAGGGSVRGSPVMMMSNGSNGGRGLNGVKTNRNITWGKDVAAEKMSFTMRREIDKAREETDLINQLRHIIETRLKMALPADLAPALTDGVVLCHLANHIRPRSVASIHVPSPAVPKLTMARCRRNVDNFIEACRKIGVDENLVCCAADVLEGRGLVQVAITVMELLRFHSPKSPLHTSSVVSTVI